ncbi:YbfB/YjiJ family MFS transporter [Pandoraea sp. XJJ-1]|uniref:Major facilitator superfamily protein n=1 Tax=Variovorax paradoxus TaxID=34073 RepID=A0A0H2M6K7_VARPD|nr:MULTISPECIES: YbfB/YjiJ family MFS transporter [Pseudomonadota]KLN58069.1 major facilitator superfamily protein [Variovorax paradoxus]MBL0607652.1 YbfB/YjiJ family MFS transporter [Aeromonas caviae]WAL82155.1 YbfB/YjiJ family MFS transporter [Pandoraea sp. XJJ-1]HCI1918307.1 YbfB/YjiJ family MFS transporter [Pseudomonas aeruginosa]
MTAFIRSRNLRSAAEAALVLAVGMGFGRFAFTAILPHMVEEDVLSLGEGSLAASANYAGYLLGALLAVRARAHHAHCLCLWAVIGTAACLAALALSAPVPVIVMLRGLAGAFSALSMVAASLWLLEHRGHFRGAPLLYAGVGIGIAVSAELLVLGTHLGLRSHGMWLMLGIVALAFGLASAPGLVASASQAQHAAAMPASATPVSRPAAAWPLVTIYGLAGLGYIVTATYLPLLVHTVLPDLDPAHVWAVFGLCAAPSCLLWHRIHERWGTPRALRLNLALQAVGVALPAFIPSAASYLLSALLVGGTFMGTATIAMPAAQRAARNMKMNLLATMTLVYGIGQILGPGLAETLRALSHSFSSSLAAAAAALVVAALTTVLL